MQSTWMAKLFGDREDPRRRLQLIFGGTSPGGGQPPRAALEWAEKTVAMSGSDASPDVVRVVRDLRAAEPRLTLRAATFLAEHVVGRPTG